MSDGVDGHDKSGRFEITREWLEFKLDQIGGDEGEIGAGAPLPPLNQGVHYGPGDFPLTTPDTSPRIVSPHFVRPFHPLHPIKPLRPPTDIWPERWPGPTDLPWSPGRPYPIDEDKGRDVFEELTKPELETLKKENAKLKSEKAKLIEELYFLRWGHAVLNASVTWPAFLTGPVLIRENLYPIEDVIRAAILHKRITIAQWEAKSLVEMGQIVMSYLADAEKAASVPNPVKYRENVLEGVYS